MALCTRRVALVHPHSLKRVLVEALLLSYSSPSLLGSLAFVMDTLLHCPWDY